MRRLRRGVAGDGEGQHGIDQRVAEILRDPLRTIAGNEIVLADRHVRAVLLAAADKDDRGTLAGGDRVAHFRPGQVVDPDRARLRARGRRDDRGQQCGKHRDEQLRWSHERLRRLESDVEHKPAVRFAVRAR